AVAGRGRAVGRGGDRAGRRIREPVRLPPAAANRGHRGGLMALVPTGQIVAHGRVGAFNVITMEHAEAIVTGAEAACRPVILQISENAVRFHGGRLGPIAAAARAVAEASSVDVALHLDHVVSPALLRQAPEHGFGSVMVDASRLPYARNVETTRAAAEFAHAHGLWV